MRIGLIAPPWFAVPPHGYGGIEWVVSCLAEGLTARGHEVTLFASGGSRTAARLVSVFETPPSADLGDPIVESRHLAEAYRHWREFDVIHDHTPIGLVAGAALPVPVVHTVHGEVVPRFHALFRQLAGRVEFVAISHNQAASLPPECLPRVIYNGVDLARFPAGPGGGGYLLFVGRMSREKGIVDAIEIARRARRPLRVLAKVNEAPEREYFETVVRPATAGVDVDFLFHATHDQKVDAYGRAEATLFPIAWPEPFGLVMIESMAAGTPVIAFRHGSVPEVVADGRTGFVCDTVEEAVMALGRLPLLRRAACREHVRRHFSADLNVARHEQLYLELAAEGPGLRPRALEASVTAGVVVGPRQLT